MERDRAEKEHAEPQVFTGTIVTGLAKGHKKDGELYATFEARILLEDHEKRVTVLLGRIPDRRTGRMLSAGQEVVIYGIPVYTPTKLSPKGTPRYRLRISATEVRFPNRNG